MRWLVAELSSSDLGPKGDNILDSSKLLSNLVTFIASFSPIKDMHYWTENDNFFILWNKENNK